MAKIIPSGMYCAYLRKSRKDMEAEARGEGETLARHDAQLRQLAERLGVPLLETYTELVSGDTITERPEVRRLLADISAGKWDGVFVMDVDRLGRGDSIDQGIILQTLVYSNTLIITPDKIYDPQDDADAEFFEIKLFFSRREYNMIKKRMQRGRIVSATDGLYQSPKAPFGYERYKLPGRKGWSLRIIPEKAEIVRAVFDWYANGMDGKPAGCNVIANRLNDMGVPTFSGVPFTRSSVRQMLSNPVYIGKIQWNKRVTTVKIVDGVRTKSRPLSADPILVDGQHDPIIDKATFDRVQEMFAQHAKPSVHSSKDIINPLAGLIICGECGHHMVRKTDLNRKGPSVACLTAKCPTCATYLDVVENAVLEILESWVADFEAEEKTKAKASGHDANVIQTAIAKNEEQREKLMGQMSRLYDLLEQGIYTPDLYRERRDDLTKRIAQVDSAIAALRTSTKQTDSRAVFIPRVKTVLEAYRVTDNPADQNQLLRSVIDRIIYRKTQRCYRNNKPGDFLSLEIFPRIPQ